MNTTQFSATHTQTLTGKFTSAALRLATKIVSRLSNGTTTAVFPADIKEKDLPTTPAQSAPAYSAPDISFTAPAKPTLVPAEGRVNQTIGQRQIDTAGYIVGLTTTHYQILPYEHAASNFPEKSEWWPISWVQVTRWA